MKKKFFKMKRKNKWEVGFTNRLLYKVAWDCVGGGRKQVGIMGWAKQYPTHKVSRTPAPTFQLKMTALLKIAIEIYFHRHSNMSNGLESFNDRQLAW